MWRLLSNNAIDARRRRSTAAGQAVLQKLGATEEAYVKKVLGLK